MTAETPPVAIIMGSQSDWETMKNAADTLDALLGRMAAHVPTQPIVRMNAGDL